MSSVAVIGLGGMGGRMARRLLESGHDVVVWNRTPSRTEPLVDMGAVLAGDPGRGDAASRGGHHDGL